MDEFFFCEEGSEQKCVDGTRLDEQQGCSSGIKLFSDDDHVSVGYKSFPMIAR
jgi:hypothetical protein